MTKLKTLLTVEDLYNWLTNEYEEAVQKSKLYENKEQDTYDYWLVRQVTLGNVIARIEASSKVIES